MEEFDWNEDEKLRISNKHLHKKGLSFFTILKDHKKKLLNITLKDAVYISFLVNTLLLIFITYKVN
jgi:hypothetical protein